MDAASMKQMADGIHEYLERALTPLVKRIEEIESRGVEYKGVWQAALTYQRGNLVTHQGGMWHSNDLTRDKPGDGKAWTLCVKGGDR